MRKRVQAGRPARRKCPCFGVFCFLCALITSLFGTKSASADTPLAAIKSTPLAAPAAVLGVTHPYVIAGAIEDRAPEVLGFTFSQDLVDLVNRVEDLAMYGLELNQRKPQHSEKLNLRVESRLGGGVLQLCYRR